MSEEIVNTIEFQYKFQLRGAILCVAFQVFALAFLYLMSWNYELIKTTLTPMFWAVLFSISLHGPKASMVHYLCKYDDRLKDTIQPKVKHFKKHNSLFWWLPTFIITILYRICYFWQPIFFDVKHHARRYSKTNFFVENESENEYMPSPSKSYTQQLFSENENEKQNSKDSSSLTSFTYNATSEDADDESEISELSSAGDHNQFENKSNKKEKSKVNKFRQSISLIEKKGEKVIVGGGKKVYSISKWLTSPLGLFCSLFVVLCAMLLKSDVVDQLGLYTIFSNLFIFLVIIMIIAAIFVLIPAWGKATYNTFVVVFLILTLIGASTLISGVLLFKIADETTRFVALVNQVVDNSEVFKNLHMDEYLNASSAKLLESLQIHLGPEMDEETFKKILANDHVNWTETFATIFAGDKGENDTNSTLSIQATINETCSNNTDITIDQEGDDNGLMAELSKLTSGDFDVIKFSKKLAKSIFGEHEWVKAVINLDFQKYMEKAQEWGLDLPFINKIFIYAKQFTTVISANLFGIIGLLLSFSSWIISLGLDFMVFLACLFYLLVESDAVFATIKEIASVVPSDLNTIESAATPLVRDSSVDSTFETLFSPNPVRQGDRNPHFLHSLFKSIQDIFVVTFKIFVLHALVTWCTFSMFDVDFSFATAFTSGVFSIIPYFPPWIVCIHGVIYLIYQHQVIYALIMLSMHFALLWIDPILMERIENSHPYLTGTSIVLGLTQFGLNGAIIGPLLICITAWSLKVIAFYCRNFTTFEIGKQTLDNSPNKIKGKENGINIEAEPFDVDQL
eukprot:211515_1